MGILKFLTHPSDLTVVAVKRDSDINYERMIDKLLSNYKNCRI